jgi:hypothetical protein
MFNKEMYEKRRQPPRRSGASVIIGFKGRKKAI